MAGDNLSHEILRTRALLLLDEEPEDRDEEGVF